MKDGRKRKIAAERAALGDGKEGEQGGVPPSKLEDGFYEIEDLRKKRVRKGQLQYLIKWRGWPESANTWEPLDNIQLCSDIIHAFEQRLLSPRKRKRRAGGPHANKNKCTPPYPADAPDNNAIADKPSSSGNLEGGIDDIPSAQAGREADAAMEHANKKQAMGEFESNANNGHLDVMRSEGTRKNKYGQSGSFAQEKESSCMEVTARHYSGQLPGARGSDSSPDVLFNDECSQTLQSGCLTGAKRRKSGSVKRFEMDPLSCDHDKMQIEASNTANKSFHKGKKLGNEVVESNEVLKENKNKMDASASSHITKLMKAVSFYASISDNMQQVLIKFEALRSDGKEVVVDNKYLRDQNPHLGIYLCLAWWCDVDNGEQWLLTIGTDLGDLPVIYNDYCCLVN